MAPWISAKGTDFAAIHITEAARAAIHGTAVLRMRAFYCQPQKLHGARIGVPAGGFVIARRITG